MDFWAISCDKSSANCLFRGDNYASWLNRLSRLKRHLLEKMSIVCWLGSVPHTSGKAVNLNTCINIFPLGSLCPKWSIIWQRIRSLELTGLQCLFTCIPQQHSCPTTTPRPPMHRTQEICTCRAELRPWCQRWLNPERFNSKTQREAPQWRKTGRKVSSCLRKHVFNKYPHTRQGEQDQTFSELREERRL